MRDREAVYDRFLEQEAKILGNSITGMKVQKIKEKNGDEKSRVYGDTFSIFSSNLLPRISID